ncbi:MAG: Si-specific NAD(P)(+) transhydrogenase [Thermoleophilaceae bacterium]|nr:Si-specific NAD(P)(+) transhydrogenase [Thermoleophilaceae bacterium]
MDLDLLVLGSGPSGQRAAVQGAKLGKRVAVVERRERVGGVSIHSGTIPSKTLREAVFEALAGRPLDAADPLNPQANDAAATRYLRDRTLRVVSAEAAVVREQLRRNNVGMLYGEASFSGPHSVAVKGEDGTKTYTAERIVIAVGTVPARPADVSFDDRTVIDSDGILRLEHRPRTMTVVGAGVIGVEYASMMAALGVKVTLVDGRADLLPFLDREIAEALQFLLRRRGVTFRREEEVTAVERRDGGAVTELRSGKRILTETVLYAAGRQGATGALGLEHAGLAADARGRIDVGEDFRTAVPHIFAVGDVAGPPGLAAIAYEQGRIATLHAFDQPATVLPGLVPTGVYAIPEIGMVGSTEEQLTEAAVPYVVGLARWSELARGLMTGDEDGILKLLIDPEDGTLLGVHVLGTTAADLVHIGQALMGRPGALDFLLAAVFNYPTFAESYKVAALDAQNRIRLGG